MTPLPVFLSIPHGGFRTPPELAGRVCLDRRDLLDDSDAFTLDIYNLGSQVVGVITTDIARAFVDLNRAPEDRPPENPDGVVKSATCYGRPIYAAGQEPDAELVAQLIKHYYEPYHERIQKALRRPEVELALDCHSMAAVGPPIAPDVGKRRPMICLGNGHGKTCSQEMIERLADCFRQAFSLEAADVTINQPFAGGYITRTYGGNPLPWVQVEISRALYLEPPWFDRQRLTMNRTRLQNLNTRFRVALCRFFG